MRFNLRTAALIALLCFTAVGTTGCSGYVRDLLGLPSKSDTTEQEPWQKPRSYVAALDKTLGDIANGYVKAEREGRMTKVAYLAAEPDILAARKRLNEASEILKSADISRGLSDAALDDLQKKADLFAAEAYEKVALVRAAAAANIIKRIRPALDLANGVAPEAVQALPPPDPKIGG